MPAPTLCVYLDDERPLPDALRYSSGRHWVVIRDARSFIALVDALGVGAFAAISFDHDLGPRGLNGYDCITHIERKLAEAEPILTTLHIPTLRCHSANPSGRIRIHAVIARIQRRYTDFIE